MTSPVPSASADTRWGDEIAVEYVKGVPFRMYTRRPRQVAEILPLAHRWGSRAHIVQGARDVNFDALLAAVFRKAQYLREQRIKRGDRVLILGWNSPDWIVNFWACAQCGAVPALANAWWSPVEVSDAIDQLQPDILLADRHGFAKLPNAGRRGRWEADFSSGLDVGSVAVGTAESASDENDPAVIIFTSGTAGRSKAVELSNRSLVANLQMLLHMTHRLPDEVDDTSGEVVLHTGPLFHVGGPQGLMRSIAVGNTIVMPSGRFEPGEALELIERHHVTRWAVVPTMVSRLLDHPNVHTRDLRGLRAVTIGGAPIHAEMLERIRSLLPAVNAGVPTGYGLTENCGQATAASGQDTVKHPGTAGRPLPCVEMKFLPVEGQTDAEILIRSPTQMTRYIGSDESPIDGEGWLHTGDLGHLDDDGRLWVTGRSKDLIIRGGENISPVAVERALMNIPGVVEAAVVGVPHPDLGEEVCAFVVVKEPKQAAEGIRDRLLGSVASFAVPSIWHVQQEPLPTNHTGKVDKRALTRRSVSQS
jgi:acyl-CoA synthetase (AMP-forming)/AMP-acid ligase II